MEYSVDFSVIIPHRNSLHLLPKLLSSIPVSEKIEIILVDNSPKPIVKDEINSDRDFQLFYSSPKRGAGGARNEGIEHANGKWLIFADADDYFAENAFNCFQKYSDCKAELVYFCADGIYLDSGEHSSRADKYTKLVGGYLNGTKTETDLRLSFTVPWAKMISHKLVETKCLQYDEVVASNDEFFSLLSGYYADSVIAVDEIVYIVTVSKGSLTKRMDKDVILSRFIVELRYNQFVKTHGLSNYQKSIMNYMCHSINFGLLFVLKCIVLLIKYKQNPFVGCKNWISTVINLLKRQKTEGKYYTR